MGPYDTYEKIMTALGGEEKVDVKAREKINDLLHELWIDAKQQGRDDYIDTERERNERD